MYSLDSMEPAEQYQDKDAWTPVSLLSTAKITKHIGFHFIISELSYKFESHIGSPPIKYYANVMLIMYIKHFYKIIHYYLKIK